MHVPKLKNIPRYKAAVWIVAVALIAMLAMSACLAESRNTDAPKIAITADTGAKIDIPYVIGLNQWNGAKYDRKSIFQIYADENSILEAPYVEIGSTIQIDFKNNYPDSFIITDQVLSSEGLPRYTEKEINTVPVVAVNNTYSFDLPAHWASMLSSYSGDYEKGNSVRGFILKCRWGDNECEYGFVLRSDAMVIFNEAEGTQDT